MYEDRILAFIDILGFKNYIKDNTIKNGLENKSETKKIDYLLEKWQKYLKSRTKVTAQFRKSMVVNQFSDSLIISYLKQEESGVANILFDISYLCIAALESGFLLRGAIVCDKVYHTKKKIFGPAMIKAYEMEEKMAIYPRIILDDNIISIAGTYHSRNHSYCSKIDFIEKGILMKDLDGLSFVDYFHKIRSELNLSEYLKYLELLREKIIEGLKIKYKPIKQKYSWMKEKYNITIKKLKKECKNGLNNEYVMDECPEFYDYFKKIKLLRWQCR